MKKLLLLFLPLMFFFGCEEDNDPQAMPMNNCGTVNLSIDNGENLELFNGEDPESGYECSISLVYQTGQEAICNIRVCLNLYTDSGEVKYRLVFNAFKETWGEAPNPINNPFDPYQIYFQDYDNFSEYSAGDNPITDDGTVDYTVDYDAQTISGSFSLNVDPFQQAQNNNISLIGDFSDIPFILYVQ